MSILANCLSRAWSSAEAFSPQVSSWTFTRHHCKTNSNGVGGVTRLCYADLAVLLMFKRGQQAWALGQAVLPR